MGWSRTNKFPSEAFTPVSAVLPWASMPLDYHDIRMAFVSCVSPTLFQPVGSGSHLYPAHRNTVRSGHRVKGLTDSRGSFPLGLPCPRLLYPYCITTWEICQGVFYLFSRNFLKCPTVDGDSHSPPALPGDYRTSLGSGLTSP